MFLPRLVSRKVRMFFCRDKERVGEISSLMGGVVCGGAGGLGMVAEAGICLDRGFRAEKRFRIASI